MTVAHIMEKSLEFCCKKEKNTREQIVEYMQAGRSNVHSDFRYALARTLCELINESNIYAIYLFGSTVKDDARIASDIDLVVHVKSKEEKLLSLLEKLNFELLQCYKKLLGEKALNINKFLDVHLVDDREVKDGDGYGILLSSIFNRPLKIWSKAS